MTKGVLRRAEKYKLVPAISLLMYGVLRAKKNTKPILSLKAVAKYLGCSRTAVKRYLVPTLQRASSSTIRPVGRPSKLTTDHVEFLIS